MPIWTNLETNLHSCCLNTYLRYQFLIHFDSLKPVSFKKSQIVPVYDNLSQLIFSRFDIPAVNPGHQTDVITSNYGNHSQHVVTSSPVTMATVHNMWLPGTTDNHMSQISNSNIRLRRKKKNLKSNLGGKRKH